MNILLILTVLVSVTVFSLSPETASALGAIAVSDNGGKGLPAFAITVRHDTPEKAASAAIAKCISNGGTTCRIVANFSEKCGAFASSPKSSGAGWGIRRKSARNMALRNCGDDSCEIVGIECEYE